MNTFVLRKLIITTICEISGVTLAFFIAYSLRSMRDWIPFIQLPIPYISYEQFIPFVLSGVCIWILVLWRGGNYHTRLDTPITVEIQGVLVYSFFWFFIYIGFIYLSTGFIFSKEIPRLIILYTYIFATLFSVIIRSIIYIISRKIYSVYGEGQKNILVIGEHEEQEIIEKNPYSTYVYLNEDRIDAVEEYIRENRPQSILFFGTKTSIESLFGLAKIYGIPISYPKVAKSIGLMKTEEYILDGKVMIELRPMAISAWERIGKRLFDILGSAILIIILIPVFFIVGLGVYISDPSGPIIYKNRRIGQNGKIFSLYKFRYMYWKFCVKEEYGIHDNALDYEEKLKKERNTREGPLYKIGDDPRKMPWGAWIEKLSLDELPQLYNVLKGDMSIIGPRPHQPREIALYDESDKQVLTVKPGITGMAQVYGRDKNTFKEEIALDTHYIEQYSPFLDFTILMRTLFVVVRRMWR